MGLLNKRILILAIICALFILFAGCSPSNMGIADSNDKPDKQAKKTTIERDAGLNSTDGLTKNGTSKETFQEKANNAVYVPPKGSFVLGKYSSPNEQNSVTLWGWHELNDTKLQVDYILWDWKRKENKKLLSLTKEDKRTIRSPVIWLDNNRVLIEGLYLYNVNNQEISQILSDQVAKVFDYAVNELRSIIAILGQSDDYMGLWLIHINTGYVQEVSLFDKDQYGELGAFNLAWGTDNILYFDGVEAGTATIYEYEINNYLLTPLYSDAKLIDFDKQTGSINYLQLESKKSKEIEILGSDEERIIIKKAADYINNLGLEVGNEPGKIALAIENIFGNKAVVLYGFWASEFLGEIVLKNINGTWQVDFERQRYFLPYQNWFAEASEFLSAQEGFKYGEEPGKNIIGTPYWNDELIVFLVSSYGEPWEWEYHVVRKNNSWEINKKIQIKGEVADWWSQGSPGRSAQEFLDNVFKENYSLAYRSIYSANILTLEEFKDEMTHMQSKMKSIDYDLGENRIEQQEGLARVQVWFIGESYNQNEIFYGWLELVNVQGSWKISWPLSIVGI